MPVFLTVGPRAGGGTRRGGGATPDSGGGSLSPNVALQQGRTDGSTASIRAGVIVPLMDSSAQSAATLVLANALGVEQQILAPVELGIYSGSGRPRCLYTEVMVSGATGATTYTAYFDRGSRTLSPLSTRSYASWEDSSSHELPAGMMADRLTTGHPPAVLLPSSADYMCGCGAFGMHATRTQAEALPVIGADAAFYHAILDTWLRDYHWDGNAAATAFCTNTNSSFNGHDLTSTATGGETVTTWIGPLRPPRFYNWNVDSGVTGFSGKGQNYYNTDASYFKEFIRSANLAYYWRGCSIAEAYRHANMWSLIVTSGGTVGEVRPMFGNMELQQPEGMGWCYLLTGNPDHRLGLQQMVHYMTIEGGAPGMGDYTSGYGWGRPMERFLGAHLWAYLCSRSGEGTQDYAALLSTAVDTITLGTSWSHWQGTNPGTGNPYFEKDTWNANGVICPGNASVPDQGPGIDTFANGALASQLALVDDLATALLTSTQRTTILNQVKAASDRIYPTMYEGGPDVAPTHPAYPAGTGMYNGFAGTGDPDCVQSNYNYFTNLQQGFHYHPYPWLARRLGSSTYAAIANRLFHTGNGTDLWTPTGPGDIGYFDGTKAPYFPDIKISHQYPRYSQWGLGQALLMPAAGSVPDNTLAKITIQNAVTRYEEYTAITFATTDTYTGREAHARTATNWRFGDSGLAIGSSNGNITASINPTTGLITLTASAAATSTITVSQGAFSKTFTAIAQAPQFVDTFTSPSTSYDGAKWSVSGPATVASGIAHVSGNPVSTITQIPAVNLNTSGAAGAVIRVNAWDVASNYIVVGPKTGTFQGFAFHFTFGGFQIGYWTSGGTFSQQGANVVASAPMSVRFRVAAGVMYMDYDIGSGWTNHSSYTIAGSAGDFDVTNAIHKISGQWGGATAFIDIDTITVY